MSGSLAGYNPLEELDHTPPPQPQDLQHGSGGYKSKLTAMSAAVGGAACRYRECLKNHAASVGGNVTDGCGEFMPSGEEGTLEALKCAACNCHRNFHRKERGGGDGVMIVHPLQLPPPPALPPSMMTSPSSMNHHHHNQNHHHHHRSTQWGAAPPSSLPAPPPVKMAAYGSTATDSSSEEMNFNVYQSQTPYAVAKKRFRTKFSSGQKEKMMDFAEKLGWRIPREDDSQLQSFCAEVGVKRQVFKVWMHNNKNSATKKNSSGSDHHHQDDEDHHHQTPVGIAGM